MSKTEGRVGQTTNVVIGGTVTDDSTNEWVALDQKVYYELAEKCLSCVLFVSIWSWTCNSLVNEFKEHKIFTALL